MALRQVRKRPDQSPAHPQDLRGYGDSLRSLAPTAILTILSPKAKDDLDELASEFGCYPICYLPTGDVQYGYSSIEEGSHKKQIIFLFGMACAARSVLGMTHMAIHLERATDEESLTEVTLEHGLHLDTFSWQTLCDSGLLLEKATLSGPDLDQLLSKPASSSKEMNQAQQNKAV